MDYQTPSNEHQTNSIIMIIGFSILGGPTSQTWCHIDIILVCYNSEFDFQDGYIIPMHNVKMFRFITNEKWKTENWRRLASNSKEEWQQSNAIGLWHPSSILHELPIFKIKSWRWRVKKWSNLNGTKFCG